MSDYYKSCAFPKPSDRKKRKAYNGYKNKKERFCYYCGTPYAERHEVFAGKNREISIQEGFQVDLCSECHVEIQQGTTERGIERRHYWEQRFQKEYMEKLICCGMTSKQALQQWMTLIGRNYRLECEPE